MTPSACAAAVLSALPSLPLSRAFTVTVEAAGEPAPPAPPPSRAPRLHVLCRDAAAPFAGALPVDALGASGALAGRGYFEPFPGDARAGGVVHVLADRVRERDVGALLAHELVHAVDASVHALDLAGCAALACSEVRAAAAGECSAARSPATARWPAWYRALCVRNTAAASAAMAFPAEGAACVDALFSACGALGAAESPVPVVERALRRERAAAEAYEGARAGARGAGAAAAAGAGAGAAAGAGAGATAAAGPRVGALA